MLNALKSIIENSTIITHQNNAILLSEHSEDARLKEVSLSLTSFLRSAGGHLRNAIVMQGDISTPEKHSKFTHYLDDDCEHINKQCDYIIFHECDQTLRVILCEMKSSEISLGEDARIHNQFRFSGLFAKYLVDVAVNYCTANDSSPSYSDVTFHKVALVHMPNVVTPVPLGTPAVTGVSLNSKLFDDVLAIFLPTNVSGRACLSWRELMETVQ
ncbi:hypothetical protein K0L52_002842 [Vibrio fluvialis]|nr:hypothetical protein [Vibrio fluvialis]